MNDKISSNHCERMAIVYVRMSTMQQVRDHGESRQRQYALVERARELGFSAVQVIDDDLGRSGSGLAQRPGFEKLVAAVCGGTVGAVFCLEASRLARNGRDWHHLLDLCALAGVVLIDAESTYDPRIMNDRLLLGLKGTMSEYELGLLRQRALSARDSKAKRGELRFGLPAGFVWAHGGHIEKDPDQRVVESVELVFRKFAEFGSVRQSYLWFRQKQLSIPVMRRTEFGMQVGWRQPGYHNLHSILTNPLYAGAYAFGRTGKRTRMVDGRARETHGHRRPRAQWLVLIREHHSGYVTWDEYERNQTMLEDNAHMKKRAARKAGRGGRALLSGMLRCGRCGCMLHTFYGSRAGNAHRYICRGRDVNIGPRCIGVGGVRTDAAVSEQILAALDPLAIEAAREAAEQAVKRDRDAREAVAHELDEARYEARLAARRYEAVDPDKRLVAQELEGRWEAALQRVHELEVRLAELDTQRSTPPVTDMEALRALATRLPEVWAAESTDMQLKQRIVRILVEEVVVNVDDDARESVVVIHWVGGRHTQLRIRRNRPPLRQRAVPDPAAVVRKMAGQWPDREIAMTLNRTRLRRIDDTSWSELRVRELREGMGLPACDGTVVGPPTVTCDTAAERLGISVGSVKRLINSGILPAEQITAGAPWQIPEDALDSNAVHEGVQAIVARRPGRSKKNQSDTSLMLPGFNKEGAECR